MLFNRNFADLITFTRASAGWSYSPGGVLVQAAANAPRLDYDPLTLAVRGLLIEEQRTNLLWPSMYGTASAPTYYTITNAASLVSGQQAIRFVMKGVGGPNSPTTGGTQFTATGAMCQWSIVEADPASVAGAVTRLVFYKTSGTPGVWGGVNLDLTTGVATLASGTGTVTYGVSKLSNAGPNGGAVYLLWTATTNAGGETLNAYPYTITDGSASGTGKSVIVHHFQMEAGSLPSSPIVTTTAQATRAADNATITDLSKIAYNQTEGTLISKFIVPPAASTAQGIFNVNDGTIANRFIAYVLSGGLRIMSAVSNVPLTINAGALPTAGSAAKIAMAYKANDFAVSVNGGAVTMGSTLGLATGMSMLRLGGTNHAAGSEAFNSCLQRLDYIPVRKTNAELQTLSA